VTLAADWFDDFVDDVHDCGVQALDCPGGEGLRHDAADALMFGAFHAQQ
jgi:hypothetical protein